MGEDGSGSMQKRRFSLEKLDVEQLYKDVQLLNRLFSKANGKLYTANDDKMSRTRIDEMNV